MKTITLQIPVFDTGQNLNQRRRKMLEEIDELLNEYSIADVSNADALAEMFDVVQCALGYLIAYNRQRYPAEVTYKLAEAILRNANEQHLEKMRNYAAERGWKWVEE